MSVRDPRLALLLVVLAATISGCASSQSGTPADSGTASTDTTSVASTTTTTPSGNTVTASVTTTSTSKSRRHARAARKAGSTSSVTQFQPFSPQSPWNTTVTNAAVDPRSRQMLDEAARRTTPLATATGGVKTTHRNVSKTSLFINTKEWTPPIVTTQGGVSTRVVCRQLECGPQANRIHTLSIPPSISPFPGNDGWLSVLDLGAGVGYDFWRARRVGNDISYQFIKRWDLNGLGYSPPVSVDPVAAPGARGSGLPMFAGVIQPHELHTGINHALAISVPGPASTNYVQPASVTNGIDRTNSLPEGARLRLDPHADIGHLPNGANRHSRAVLLRALRTYGAIVVDRSRTPTLYARRNANYGAHGSPSGTRKSTVALSLRPPAVKQEVTSLARRAQLSGKKAKPPTPLLQGNELDGIQLRDFQVVSLGPRLKDPPGVSINSGTAFGFPVGTGSAP